VRILIGLDGSEVSEAAVGAVAKWALSSQAEIHLLSILHVDDIHETPSDRLVAERSSATQVGSSGAYGGALYTTPQPRVRLAENRGQAVERAHDERMDYLRGVAARELGGMTVNYHVEASEETAEAIVNAATELDADVIAIATHGRSGLGRMLMGSVAEEVIRIAKVPVVLVGPAMVAKPAQTVPPIDPVKSPN
jgi:nucleotide-binding universal stress UspA family protein